MKAYPKCKQGILRWSFFPFQGSQLRLRYSNQQRKNKGIMQRFCRSDGLQLEVCETILRPVTPVTVFRNNCVHASVGPRGDRHRVGIFEFGPEGKPEARHPAWNPRLANLAEAVIRRKSTPSRTPITCQYPRHRIGDEGLEDIRDRNQWVILIREQFLGVFFSPISNTTPLHQVTGERGGFVVVVWGVRGTAACGRVLGTATRMSSLATRHGGSSSATDAPEVAPEGGGRVSGTRRAVVMRRG